jgi:hypothetical protein
MRTRDKASLWLAAAAIFLVLALTGNGIAYLAVAVAFAALGIREAAQGRRSGD